MHQTDRATLELYRSSDFVHAAARDLRLTCSDVDNTLVGPFVNDLAELAERSSAVAAMESQGALALSTARVFELVMSEDLRSASREVGFNRPEPLCGFDADGKRHFVPITSLPEYRYVTDPHAIAEMGGGILLRVGNRYLPDVEYRETLGLLAWDKKVREIIHDLGIERMLAAVSQAASYGLGTVDVAAPLGRIQLEAYGESGEATKRHAHRAIWGAAQKCPELRRNIRILDESKPRRGLYMLHVMPRYGSKAASYNRMLAQTAEALGCPTSQMKALFLGDAATDANAMFAGGLDAQATGVIVGEFGECLSPQGVNSGKIFGGESFAWATKRLRPTDLTGVYSFKVSTQTVRRVVIARERYPRYEGAGAVNAFLDDKALERQSFFRAA